VLGAAVDDDRRIDRPVEAAVGALALGPCADGAGEVGEEEFRTGGDGAIGMRLRDREGAAGARVSTMSSSS
jgi:hypothetical protein